VLANIGLMLRRAGPWARIRSVGLVFSAAMLTTATFACLLAAQQYHDRELRALALQPVESSDADAKLLYGEALTTIKDRPVSVVTFEPLEADAPLPPGLSAWPGPGEAVLSARLMADLGFENAGLYGTPVGVIDEIGLVVPTERRVYRRPPAGVGDTDRMMPVSSFGASEFGPFVPTGILYRASLTQSEALVTFALVLPALLSVGLAASVDGDARARRGALLDVLGASRFQRSVVDLFESLPALALGTLVGASVISLLFLTDISIPWLDTVLVASETRRGLRWALPAVVGALVLSVATVLATRRAVYGLRSKDAVARFDTARFLPLGRVVVCFVAGIVTVWLPMIAYAAQPAVRALLYLSGIAVFAATFPAVLSSCLSVCGSIIARRALRRGWPGFALAGRRLQVHMPRTIRILLGVCGLVILMGQVQLWASVLGDAHRDAEALRKTVGSSAVSASPTDYGGALRSFVGTLDSDVIVGWSWTETIESGSRSGTTRVTFSGPCVAMRIVAGDCEQPARRIAPSTRAGTAVSITLPRDTEFRVESTPNYTELGRVEAVLWLLSANDTDLDVLDLQQGAYEFFAGGMSLTTIPQDWVTAGLVTEYQARWTVAFGLMGVGTLLVATALNLSGDIVNTARSTRAIASLTEKRSWLFGLAFVEIFLPVVIAVAFSGVAYYVLPTGMRTGDSFVTPSGVYVLGAVLVGVVAGAGLQRRRPSRSLARVLAGVRDLIESPQRLRPRPAGGRLLHPCGPHIRDRAGAAHLRREAGRSNSMRVPPGSNM
jgi:hypothetical protein